MTEKAIIGINPVSRVCEAVALASDTEGRNEMVSQGLFIGETTTGVARKLLGEVVSINVPYAIAS